MLWNLCQSIVEPVATLQLHPEEKDAKTSVNTAALPANPSGVSRAHAPSNMNSFDASDIC
jgi:hypothetical protein